MTRFIFTLIASSLVFGCAVEQAPVDSAASEITQRPYFELWEAERLSFDELLRKVKEHARAKTLDKDAANGKTGVALGAASASQEEWSWNSWADEDTREEVNAVTPGKGKGPKNSKGKSKGTEAMP